MSGISLEKVVKHSDSTQPHSLSTSTNGDMKTTIQVNATLTRYSSVHPGLSHNFTLLYNAVNSLKNSETKEGFYLLPEVHKSLSTIIETYSKTTNYDFKNLQSEFLVDIGFVSISKDMLLKLVDLCPDLLSYDREMCSPGQDINKMPHQKPDSVSTAQDLFLSIIVATLSNSKRCEKMIEALATAGYIPLLLDTLSKMKDCKISSKDESQLFQELQIDLKGMPKRTVILVNILGNLLSLSKRISIRPSFHKYNAVKILLPILEYAVNALATLALLVLAYIIDEDYNFLIVAREGPIKCLILLIEKATKAANHKAMGGSNTEMAEGLAQIAINDNNKRLIASSGAIPVLTQMISQAKNDDERFVAANVLWVLAFDKQISQQILHNTECMSELHKLRESQNMDVQKVASGALWEVEEKMSKLTIRDDEGTPQEEHQFEPVLELQRDKGVQKMKMKNRSRAGAAPHVSEDVEEKPQSHIMISYQWDVQETLIKVKNNLQAAGFNVWMDLEQMGGSTLEAMARAVEKSSVVLVCVSQKYKESANCRSEAEYAFQLKKDVIPLMMQSNYRPDGWLGMLIGAKLWIDFCHNLERLDASCEQLYKELGFRGIKGKTSSKETKPASEVQIAEKLQTNQKKTNSNQQQQTVIKTQERENIIGWTHSDVVKWMNRFNVSVKIKRIEKKLNGSTLALLNSFMNEVSAEYFYSSLKVDFGFDIVEAILFANELKRLFE